MSSLRARPPCAGSCDAIRSAQAFLNMGTAVKGAEGAVATAVSAFVIVCAIAILRRERRQKIAALSG